MSYSYVISHEKIELYITILDINNLHIHEEIIPSALNRLMRTIKVDGCLKHPVIADNKSHVVLDGMHRVAALKEFGYKRIPVCLVDYADPTILLGSWYRTIKGDEAWNRVIDKIKKINLSIKEVKGIRAEDIGIDPNVSAIKDSEKTFFIQSNFQSVKEAYNIIKHIEEELSKTSLEIGYDTETDALKKLRERKVDVVLLTPRLSKNVVVSTALSGRVFSFKSTRHVIPARPMNLDVPLSLLRKDKESLDEVNNELKQLLGERRLTHLPPGSLLDGRRYEEDLYLFVKK